MNNNVPDKSLAILLCCLALGALLMSIFGQKKMLHSLSLELKTKKLLLQLLQELVLGTIFSAAAFYFTCRIFRGEKVLQVAQLLAIVTAALSCWGGYKRIYSAPEMQVKIDEKQQKQLKIFRKLGNLGVFCFLLAFLMIFLRWIRD